MPTFEFENHVIAAEDGDTVLSALLRAGHTVENRCRAGACQACLLRSSNPPKSAQNGIDETLSELGAFLSCQAKPSEIEKVERLDDSAIPTFCGELAETKLVSQDVLWVRLEVPGFQGKPGRFVRLRHQSGVERPYSLAAPAWSDPNTVEFHVRLIPGGEMSSILANAGPGEQFEIVGPLGKCCYKGHPEATLLLIGSGTGLAPLYAIVTDALSKSHVGPIFLYHGAAVAEGLYYQDELRELAAKAPNFKYVPCADSGAAEEVRVGSPLDAALADHPEMDGYKVFLCGHPALVKAAQKKCFLWGASLADIAADAFEAS